MRKAEPTVDTREWKVVLSVAAVYYGLARLGLSMALHGTASSPVWPASGFAIAAAAVLGPAACAGALLGSALANLQTLLGSPIAPPLALAAAASVAIGLGTAAQAWVGMRAFGRFLSARCPLGRGRDVVRFAALTPLVCLISASAGATALVALGLVPLKIFGASWLTWWIGDVSGVLLVYPLMIAWLPGAADAPPEFARPELGLEAAAAAILLVLSVWIGFGDVLAREAQYPLSFLPLPMLAWAALRLGARGATAGAVLLALLVHSRTLVGFGPFAIGWSSNESLLLSSFYVTTAALTAFLVHALLAERRRAEAELREARDALALRITQKNADISTANATLRVAALGRKEDVSRIKLYRHLVEELPIGVAILRLDDPDDFKTWRIAEINPAGRRLSAAKDSERGKPLFEFAPELFDTNFPRACREALRTGEEKSVPDFVSRERAPGAHFSISVLPLGGSLVAMVFENTTAREALRRSEEQLRLMIEGVSDYAIFRLDAEGRIVSWNKGALRITGYDADEILGHSYAVLFTEEDIRSGAPNALLRSVAYAGREETEGWRVRKDGARFWTNSVLTALKDDAGRLQGYVKVLRDATERRRILQELEERTAALARSNADLTQFAYVASHDLQEPLRKAAAFAEQLRARLDGRLDATDQDFMARLLRSVDGMKSLIDALLELARVASTPAAPERVDLEAAAREAVDGLAVALAESGGTIRIDSLPAVEADPQQMRQLLQNLLANAIKFRRPDRPPSIRLYGRTLRDGSCELCVEDDGVGFDMKYAGRLFQPFQRLHSRKDFSGTGMGLAICQKIVERHGGTISVESAVDRGSTFKVVLPRGGAAREDERRGAGANLWKIE